MTIPIELVQLGFHGTPGEVVPPTSALCHHCDTWQSLPNNRRLSVKFHHQKIASPISATTPIAAATAPGIPNTSRISSIVIVRSRGKVPCVQYSGTQMRPPTKSADAFVRARTKLSVERNSALSPSSYGRRTQTPRSPALRRSMCERHAAGCPASSRRLTRSCARSTTRFSGTIEFVLTPVSMGRRCLGPMISS